MGQSEFTLVELVGYEDDEARSSPSFIVGSSQRKGRVEDMSKKAVSFLLTFILLFLQVSSQDLVCAKAHNTSTGQHTEQCYCGEKHLHSNDCGTKVTRYGCNMCNYTGYGTTGHTPSWTQTWGQNGGECPSCGSSEPGIALVVYTCWCGDGGTLYACPNCSYREDLRPTYHYDDCEWCHNIQYRTKCTVCNGTGTQPCARCSRCGTDCEITATKCSYCGGYDLDKDSYRSCPNCIYSYENEEYTGTVFAGRIGPCDAGCSKHVHTEACKGEPGCFCELNGNMGYTGGSYPYSAPPTKICSGCGNDLICDCLGASVPVFCCGCSDGYYNDYDEWIHTGAYIMVTADIYRCTNENCYKRGMQPFPVASDTNYKKTHENPYEECVKSMTACRKGENWSFLSYKNIEGEYVSYYPKYYISHEPSYWGTSGYCTTCHGRGYRLYPPCTLEDGKYYDTSGNKCDPVCDKTIKTMTFQQ